MGNAEKSFIGLQALLIKKLITDYKNRTPGNDILVAIQNHADRIIELTVEETC